MKYPLLYGAIGGAVAIGLLELSMILDLPGHHQSLWFGYLVMLAGLSFIFVGVKRYRDVECGGVISFGRSFAVGLGIALVASLIYVAGWEAYQALSDKDFMTEYMAAIVGRMRAEGASAAAINAKLAELHTLAENYKNPLFRLPMTFIEIFPVGLLVALVSAAVLRNPRLLPARS